MTSDGRQRVDEEPRRGRERFARAPAPPRKTGGTLVRWAHLALVALAAVGCGETLSTWRAPNAPRPKSVVVLPFRSALWELYVEDDPAGADAPFSVESSAGCRRALAERGLTLTPSSPVHRAIECDLARAAAYARSVGADAVIVGALYTHKFSQEADVTLVRARDGAVLAKARTEYGKDADGLGYDACSALVRETSKAP